jgi:glycosyltransferase involved in cell wall biosynthesis
MEWLRSHDPTQQLFLISLHKSELTKKFKELSDGFIELDDLKMQLSYGLKEQLLQKLGVSKKVTFQELLTQRIKDWPIDLIYANTILSIPLAREIKTIKPNAKIIAHVHELEAIIKMSLPELSLFKEEISSFISPAKLVTDNLIENHQIDKNVITTIPECSKINISKDAISSTNSKKVFTIGGSGTVHWRKGSDLFIQVAHMVLLKNPDVKIQFLWIGRMSKSEEIILNEDLKKMGLFNHIEFIGSVINPQDYYKKMDIFLMTSREDPFPLVCIEIGMMGIPIVYFDKAIGTQEVLESAGGKKIPYLDLLSMSEAIIDYYYNPDRIKEDGMKNKIAFSKFTPELICPHYYEVCKAVFLND